MMISGAGAIAATPRDFVPGSYQAILDTRQGEAFILLFWSLDCPPCHRELATLGTFVSQQAGLPLVLVSTDEKAMAHEAAIVLQGKGLAMVESWIFADDFHQRLRFEVDRNWYGELPRSYLFDTDHQRSAYSGVLDRAVLRTWLEQQGFNE